MKQILHVFCMLIIIHSCKAITIQASSLSCITPTEINESAIIELDAPLNINGPNICELLTAGAGFGATDTVTFRPTQSNIITLTSDTILNDIGMLEIQNPGIWDVRSFNQTTQRFIFENVELIMHPGSSILANGITFQLLGTSKIITQAVTIPT